MSKFHCLHLYPQKFEHDSAFVVGSREALTALRDTVDAALRADTRYATTKAFANDGEGYSLEVHCLSMDDMDRMVQPYTDPVDMPRGRSPWDLPTDPECAT